MADDLNNLSEGELRTMLADVEAQLSDTAQPDLKVLAKEAVAANPPSIFEGIGQGVQDGYLLGYGDEARRGYAGLTGVDPVEADLTQEIDREMSRTFFDQHPYLSVGSNIVGSIPAALVTRNPQTVGGRALMGLGLGGFTGFGSGEGGFGSRLGSTAAGAVLGAGGSLAMDALIAGGGGLVRAAGDAFDNYAPDFLRSSAKSQTGAIGETGRKAAETVKPTAEEIVLGRVLARNQTAGTIDDMAAQLAAARSEGAPVILSDVGGDSVQGVADYLANVAPETRGAPRQFLDERYTDTGARLASYVEPISPEVTAEAAGATARKAAQDIEGKLTTARETGAQELYAKIGDYAPSAELEAVRTDPQVIRAAKNLAENDIKGQRFLALPENSPQRLIQVRQALREEADKLFEAKDKTSGRILLESADKITAALETQGEFAPANTFYREKSQEIGTLFGEGNDTGIIEKLSRLDKLNTEQAGELIMGLSPEALQQLKKLGGAEADKAIRAGVKAHMLNVVNTTRETRNPLDKLAIDPAYKATLLEALGPVEGGKILKKLDIEQMISKGSKALGINSKTAPRQETAKMFRGLLGRAGEAAKSAKLTSPTNSIIDFMISTDVDEQVMKNASEILFSPQLSEDFLRRNAPRIKQAIARADAIKKTTQAAGKATSKASGLLGGQAGGGITKK
jgi:hypothetical protein